MMRTTVLTLLVIATTSVAVGTQSPSTASPSTQGFARLKALEGEWIDVDGVFGKKGAVAATYKVTGGGNTVIETFPLGLKEEMVTVYHLDGNDLVLTHYCAGGTQPRMRSKGLTGNALVFDFDGGANIDAAVTSHMHAMRMEFVSRDELKATWTNWSKGKPDDHTAMLRIIRKQ
jgi:hypothetical protein